MINLLPQDQQKSILYARHNTRLLHWCLIMVSTIFVLIAMWGVGYFYISSSITSYNNEISSKQEDLKSQNLEETQKRIEDLSNNLKLILQVLSKEVLFSKVFKQIGAVMPDGSVLSSVEINKVEGGLDLTARAKNYDTGTQIQVNLSDKSNKLFQKVDIVSVSCTTGTSSTNSSSTTTTSTSTTSDSTTTTDSSKYPCTVSLRALFSTDNPFLFINKSGSGT